MAQRNSRASVGGEEDVLTLPSPLAPDKGATALDLVYQAADVFRGMEKHARETEARAQSLCTSALEGLRLAEMRAEAAERAQRELIVTAERKLQHACRALERSIGRSLSRRLPGARCEPGFSSRSRQAYRPTGLR